MQQLSLPVPAGHVLIPAPPGAQLGGAEDPHEPDDDPDDEPEDDPDDDPEEPDDDPLLEPDDDPDEPLLLDESAPASTPVQLTPADGTTSPTHGPNPPALTSLAAKHVCVPPLQEPTPSVPAGPV